MSYRRQIPKLNEDNFKAWQGLMRLHLENIGDTRIRNLYEKYKNPTRTMTIEEIVEKKSHNIMMIDITSALSYAKFDEIKE